MDGTVASLSTARALHAPAVDATLRTVTAVTGMELAFVASVGAEELVYRRVAAAPRVGAGDRWHAFVEGGRVASQDTLCALVAERGPLATADVAADPALAPRLAQSLPELVSYVGVPVEDPDGGTFGTLCGADRTSVAVTGRTVDGLRELAAVVSARLAEAGPSLVRDRAGWRVTGLPAGQHPDELLSAMVLADLLSVELGEPVSTGRPARAEPTDDEVSRLRLSVSQLEHALAARVVVEQAIGVLAERRHVAPRAAFEVLRGVARGSGRRVHDLAQDVVSSAVSGRVTSLLGPLGRPGSGAPSPAVVAQAIRVPRPAPPVPQPSPGQPAP